MWHEVGECETGDIGPRPITWGELAAWQRLTERNLTPWELQTLRKMSDAYVVESYQAKDRGRPAPYASKSPAKISAARIKQVIRGAR